MLPQLNMPEPWHVQAFGSNFADALVVLARTNWGARDKRTSPFLLFSRLIATALAS